MVQIQVEVNLDEFAGLSTEVKELLEANVDVRRAFVEMAVEEYLKWVSGEVVHQSITEQHTERLAAVFPVFFPDTAPSPGKIFNHFSIPFGRAAYISRVLLEMDSARWRQTAKNELTRALERVEPDAEGFIKNSDPLQRLEVSLSQAAYRELTVLLEALHAQDDTLDNPVGKGGVTGRKTLEISAQLIIAALKNIRG